MKDPIKDTMRKTLSYWYVDGLTELATGLLLSLAGVFYAALATFLSGAAARQISTIGLPILILLGGLASRRAVSSLKERLTYPRTGYVACIKTRAALKLGTAAIGVAGSLVFVFAAIQFNLDWLKYLAPGLMAAVMLAFIGFSYGLHRFYGLAVYALLLGGLMVLLHLEDHANTALLLLGCGAGFFVSGALTLKGYLQGTRPPLGEVE